MDPLDHYDAADNENSRSLLDQLLEDARLYKSSKDYMSLLNFISQMRNFAPFNALLLQIQKPGIRFAASKHDWRERHGAEVNEDARPLLILWPFGPVALVYDLLDTEGGRIPEDAQSFVAKGSITNIQINGFIKRMEAKEIFVRQIDSGDSKAGSISILRTPKDAKTRGYYDLEININHDPNVRFVTIAHELAHLFLGHLGEDKKWGIRDRMSNTKSQQEIEAESVSYLVSKRNGVSSKSQVYLSDYVAKNETMDSLDLYQITRAAGQIETLLGINGHSRFDKPGSNCQNFQEHLRV